MIVVFSVCFMRFSSIFSGYLVLTDPERIVVYVVPETHVRVMTFTTSNGLDITDRARSIEEEVWDDASYLFKLVRCTKCLICRTVRCEDVQYLTTYLYYHPFYQIEDSVLDIDSVVSVSPVITR